MIKRNETRVEWPHGRSLPWPLFTIDFEASTLGPGSYPIEVGVCRWCGPDHPIEGWSTLIRPIPLWTEKGVWGAAAQEVHGIRREELQDGMDPTDAVAALNIIIQNNAAFCDGGVSDFGWARRLVIAAGVMNTFKLGDFDMLTGFCDSDGYGRLVRWLDKNPAPHRARPDAERLMVSLRHGLNLQSNGSARVSLRM